MPCCHTERVQFVQHTKNLPITWIAKAHGASAVEIRGPELWHRSYNLCCLRCSGDRQTQNWALTSYRCASSAGLQPRPRARKQAAPNRHLVGLSVASLLSKLKNAVTGFEVTVTCRWLSLGRFPQLTLPSAFGWGPRARKELHCRGLITKRPAKTSCGY